MAINNSIDSKQSLSINDSPQFANIQIVSTTNGSHPIPSMTSAQRDAISSPANGDCTFVTDVSPARPYIYNGDWQGIVYISDLSKSYASYVTSSGASQTFVNSTPKLAVVTAMALNSSNFTIGSDGVVTYNGTSGNVFEIKFIYTVFCASGPNTYAFYVAKNGTQNTNSLQKNDLTTEQVAAHTMLTTSLNVNDTISPFIANLGTIGTNLTIQQCVMSIIQIN